jgi:hypothetical protein
MTSAFSALRSRLFPFRLPSSVMGWSAIILIVTAWLPSACTRFLPPDRQRDVPAERMMSELRQTNAGLTRFKCVAKIILSDPERPTQSFRAAVAGQLTDHLRIDMFAPFGGSAGTVSSDGKHLFLVTHPSREYYKKRIGSGSLRRIVQLDITVGDLLELLVGRIPMDATLSARLSPDESSSLTHLILEDRWGRTRQQISLDASMRPFRAIWFDVHHKPIHTLTVSGQQTIDGYVLPTRIELSAESGQRVSVALDRYEANVRFDESLFILDPPSS